MKELPGKGNGLVATQKIKRDEILILDFPALVVDPDYLETVSERDQRRLLWEALYQLPNSTQEEVISLSRSTDGEKIEAILSTNACGIEIDDTRKYSGLFPKVSVS